MDPLYLDNRIHAFFFREEPLQDAPLGTGQMFTMLRVPVCCAHYAKALAAPHNLTMVLSDWCTPRDHTTSLAFVSSEPDTVNKCQLHLGCLLVYLHVCVDALQCMYVHVRHPSPRALRSTTLTHDRQERMCDTSMHWNCLSSTSLAPE
jgi:hypothetical protein